jgi:hypothetical protein
MGAAGRFGEDAGAHMSFRRRPMYARLVGRLVAFAISVAISRAAKATCSADAVAPASAFRWTSGERPACSIARVSLSASW